MTPTRFARQYPGVAVYARIVRRVARRYGLRVRMYLEFPLCRIVYNRKHIFWVDLTFYKITCERRCEYNAQVALGLNPDQAY